MPNTRDELIADWRKRLAAATEAPEEPSSRAAWLVRLRVRLYRFLLSLYGDGQWRESVDSIPKQGPPVATLVESLALEGKPAKDADTIREALQAIANARTHATEQGPLAPGQGDDAWLIIASASAGIDPGTCVEVLQSHRITPRVVRRGGDVTVEVRAKHVANATSIVGAHINRLRWHRRRVVPTNPGIIEGTLNWSTAAIARIPSPWRFALVTVAHLALTFPFAWIGATVVFAMQAEEIKNLPFSEDDFVQHFWTVWRGFFVIALLLIWLRVDRQKRRTKSLDRTRRRGSTGR